MWALLGTRVAGGMVYGSPVGVPQAWLSSILTPRELGCNLGPAKLAELRLMVPCLLG